MQFVFKISNRVITSTAIGILGSILIMVYILVIQIMKLFTSLKIKVDYGRRNLVAYDPAVFKNSVIMVNTKFVW